MNKILLSGLLVGLICFIASIIHDKTKLTPGHITTIFVIVGAIMSVFNIYDFLIDKFGFGLCLPITSFGNSLTNSAYEGFRNLGIIGLFSNLFVTTSAGIAGTIFFSFLITAIFHAKD